jgi:hypothetical protein
MGCSTSDPSLPAPFSLDGAATAPLPDLRFLAIFNLAIPRPFSREPYFLTLTTVLVPFRKRPNADRFPSI